MSLRPLTLIAFGLALLSGISSEAWAASPWTELKEGMNGEATVEKIGLPVLSTRGRGVGRGVEVWIYDHGGEAVFKNDSLLFWSAPVVESPAKKDPVSVARAAVGAAAGPQAAPMTKVPTTRPRPPAPVVGSSI